MATAEQRKAAAMQRHPAGKARSARQRWLDRIAPLMPPEPSTLDRLDGVGTPKDAS